MTSRPYVEVSKSIQGKDIIVSVELLSVEHKRLWSAYLHFNKSWSATLDGTLLPCDRSSVLQYVSNSTGWVFASSSLGTVAANICRIILDILRS